MLRWNRLRGNLADVPYQNAPQLTLPALVSAVRQQLVGTFPNPVFSLKPLIPTLTPAYL
jgi:hypothetical protein